MLLDEPSNLILTKALQMEIIIFPFLMEQKRKFYESRLFFSQILSPAIQISKT